MSNKVILDGENIIVQVDSDNNVSIEDSPYSIVDVLQDLIQIDLIEEPPAIIEIHDIKLDN